MSILNKLVPESPETDVSSSESSMDFEKVRQRIFGGGNKNPRRKSSDKSTDEKSEKEKELASLFAGENWEGISSLYFDARFAVTGYTGFLLTDPQKKTLGMSLGKAAEILLKIDPGYVALIVFCGTFGGLVAQKEIAYKHALKELEKEENAGRKAS